MSVAASKSNLAKLLASEDILVEQRNTQTAFFDIKNRTLVIPTFKKDLSNDLVDLFISHEVGHCLWTTTDDWGKIKTEKLRTSIVNVVEDSRIERLIKQKYPGLKSVYARAYKELMDMDFFGLKKMDISTINLADKINLYCKVGFIPFVSFSAEEKAILDKVENTQTFDQVLEVSREIQEYMKQELLDQMENQDPGEYGFDENSEREYQTSEDFDADGREEDNVDGVSENSENLESEIGDIEEDYDIEEDLESFTDTYSNMTMLDLYSEDTRESVYVDVPEIDLKDFVVDYKTLYARLREDVPEVFKRAVAFNTFKSENSSIVSYLVKEFNLKKNAQGRKKVKESKTGDINLNKVYSYKYNNDIFKRSTKVPGEKNHCMVFFLDWSASMEPYIQDTIKQLMCLVMFCKKLNIPYEVYAFSSSYYDAGADLYSIPEYKEKTAALRDVRLLNILSYKMGNNEFIAAANILLSYTGYCFAETRYDCYYSNSIGRIPGWFSLGNTPLNHAVILSDKVATALKEKTKTDIVNVITMSDGDSHSIVFKKEDYARRISDRNLNVYLRDKKKKISQYVTKGTNIGETNSCLDFIKQFNDYRYFGFRLISQRELKNEFPKFVKNYQGSSNYLSKFKQDNSLKADGTSFDEFYFIKANSINKKEEEIEIKEKETVNAIAKKFNKALSSRTNNRVFLKKFISFVS